MISTLKDPPGCSSVGEGSVRRSLKEGRPGYNSDMQVTAKNADMGISSDKVIAEERAVSSNRSIIYSQKRHSRAPYAINSARGFQ